MSVTNYCADCLVGTNNTACPMCGSTGLRPASLNDWCFLTRQETLWAPALRDYLTDNGIFFITQPAGRGIAIYGVSAENLEAFFVRAVDLDRARDLTDAFLAADTFLEDDGTEWLPNDEIII